MELENIGDAAVREEELQKLFDSTTAEGNKLETAAETETETTELQSTPEQKPDKIEQKSEPESEQESITDPRVTELERQLAELRAENEKFKGLSDRLDRIDTKIPEPAPVDDTPEELKSFYEVYPEAKQAVEFEAEKKIKAHLDPIKKQLSEISNTMSMSEFRHHLLTGFIHEGKFIPGHSDAKELGVNPDFINVYNEEKQKNPLIETDLLSAHNFILKYKTEQAKKAEETQEQKKNAEAYFSEEIPKGSNSGEKKENVLSLEELFKKEMKAA